MTSASFLEPNIVRCIMGPFKFRAYSKRGAELQKEMDKFNDFIVGDFIDSYRNLTLKTFTGYKYVNEYCLHNEKKLVLMHDDDTLINEANFKSHYVNFNKLEMIQKGWD